MWGWQKFSFSFQRFASYSNSQYCLWAIQQEELAKVCWLNICHFILSIFADFFIFCLRSYSEWYFDIVLRFLRQSVMNSKLLTDKLSSLARRLLLLQTCCLMWWSPSDRRWSICRCHRLLIIQLYSPITSQHLNSSKLGFVSQY